MPKIIGNGAPTNNTPGVLGQEYFDKDSNTVYTCIKAEHKTLNGDFEGEYEWAVIGGSGGSKTLKVHAQPIPDTFYKYSTELTRDAALEALYNGDDIEIIVHDPDYGGHIRVLRVFHYSDPASNFPELWFVGWQFYSESFAADVQYYQMQANGTIEKI